MKEYRIPFFFMRGGTSRGPFFLQEDLPEDPAERDRLLLRIMGSPDKKQIDGIGGATSVTSKVAMIRKSDRPDADVDYTFAQVSVDKPFVSYLGNCGNMSSAVGPFSIEKGLVPAEEGVTKVRIYNTNTDKIIIADVQVRDGKVVYYGDYSIAGVPGTASPSRLYFKDPAGTLDRGLLPTGRVTDVLEVPDFGKIECSIVDAANPLVFIRAKDVGLSGGILAGEIDRSPELLDLLERIRGMAAVRLGLIDDYKRSAWDSAAVPKMAIVSPPCAYAGTSGGRVEEEDIDLSLRMMSMQKAHPTCAMTGAMCTAAAAVIKGSIVNEALRPGTDLTNIRIGHSDGVICAGVEAEMPGEAGVPTVLGTYGFRTANKLAEAVATGVLE